MTLQTYFDTTAGTGILATADSNGKVDAAVYSRPHFLEDGSIVFIMRDRLTQPDLLVMAGEWTEDLMVRVLKRAST